MSESTTHAERMDGIYRYQRRIYDLSRKYFLLGRDHMIGALDAKADDKILEIACGTGRNLNKIAGRYPGTRLYGFDLSEEMLKSARRTLKGRAVLARADARTFDGRNAFGTEAFDRIIMSYGLSMMPGWQTALAAAANHLAPGGSLHVVDFGGQSGWPAWFGRLLRAWLSKFHVSPRNGIDGVLSELAAKHDGTAEFETLYRDYAVYGVLRVAK